MVPGVGMDQETNVARPALVPGRVTATAGATPSGFGEDRWS